ncbi:hypothetical protein P4C99_02565 [Pontiellaceae bacterium B1224]|nr:hypothetical protein [Pontiellaceae bacterium B1224]
MKQTYKKRTLFNASKLGQIAFALFVIFIAYRILTPPSNETVRIISPDGSKTARLRTFFYFDNQPSYEVYYQKNDKKPWVKLLYLPVYTNTPPELHQPDLQWSKASDQIDFLINGTSIWHHTFSD